MFNLELLKNKKYRFQTLSAIFMAAFLVLIGIFSVLKININKEVEVSISSANHYEF